MGGMVGPSADTASNSVTKMSESDRVTYLWQSSLENMYWRGRFFLPGPPPQLNSLLILIVDVLWGYPQLNNEQLELVEVALHDRWIECLCQGFPVLTDHFPVLTGARRPVGPGALVNQLMARATMASHKPV